MQSKTNNKKTVLVGVLKTKQDRKILFTEGWYRIPKQYAPKRRFEYIAFYQPASFGRGGRRIQHYGRVTKRTAVMRRTLFPNELRHPRARERYIKIHIGEIRALPRPIQNKTPRRVSFGFTTLERLRTAKNILELYNVPPTEEILGNALRRTGICAISQPYVTGRGKRFRLDFAVMCKRGSIAIECDNIKAHSSTMNRRKDRAKDASLEKRGWRVIRFSERDIISRADRCVARIRRAVRRLGGLHAQ